MSHEPSSRISSSARNLVSYALGAIFATLPQPARADHGPDQGTSNKNASLMVTWSPSFGDGNGTRSGPTLNICDQGRCLPLDRETLHRVTDIGGLLSSTARGFMPGPLKGFDPVKGFEHRSNSTNVLSSADLLSSGFTGGRFSRQELRSTESDRLSPPLAFSLNQSFAKIDHTAIPSLGTHPLFVAPTLHALPKSFDLDLMRPTATSREKEPKGLTDAKPN